MSTIEYTLVRSSRKTVGIQITPEGKVILRCPRRLPEAQARMFLEQKRDWVERHLEKIQTVPQLPPFTETELRAMGERLRPVLAERLEYFAPLAGVSFGRVTIRCQHTRWGSCSSKGNLNFNCLLALAPPEVLDYIVVHELCHRKEMNHSPRFWAEVSRILPGYKDQERWLKENGTALLRRLPK